jgi:hypothetical protein
MRDPMSVLACHVYVFPQFRRLGTAGAKPLKSKGTVRFVAGAGTPLHATEIARWPNIPPPAVQHDVLNCSGVRPSPQGGEKRTEVVAPEK